MDSNGRKGTYVPGTWQRRFGEQWIEKERFGLLMEISRDGLQHPMGPNRQV